MVVSSQLGGWNVFNPGGKKNATQSIIIFPPQREKIAI
jgi:hypothetical protein